MQLSMNLRRIADALERMNAISERQEAKEDAIRLQADTDNSRHIAMMENVQEMQRVAATQNEARWDAYDARQKKHNAQCADWHRRVICDAGIAAEESSIQ